jgi:hypothetical protein
MNDTGFTHIRVERTVRERLKRFALEASEREGRFIPCCEVTSLAINKYISEASKQTACA